MILSFARKRNEATPGGFSFSNVRSFRSILVDKYIFVVSMLSWPNQIANEAISTPESCMCIAVVWRSICGLGVRRAKEGHVFLAKANIRDNRFSTAERVICPPWAAGNRGAVDVRPLTCIHFRKPFEVTGHKAFLPPLSVQCDLAAHFGQTRVGNACLRHLRNPCTGVVHGLKPIRKRDNAPKSKGRWTVGLSIG